MMTKGFCHKWRTEPQVLTLVDDKSLSDKMVITHNDIPISGAHKDVASQSADKGLKKVKVSKRPVEELGSGKPVLPEKKIRKKEQLMSDGTQAALLVNNSCQGCLRILNWVMIL